MNQLVNILPCEDKWGLGRFWWVSGAWKGFFFSRGSSGPLCRRINGVWGGFGGFRGPGRGFSLVGGHLVHCVGG